MVLHPLVDLSLLWSSLQRRGKSGKWPFCFMWNHGGGSESVRPDEERGRERVYRKIKCQRSPLLLPSRCPSLKNIYFEATASPTFCCNSDNVTEGSEGDSEAIPKCNEAASLPRRAGGQRAEGGASHTQTHTRHAVRPPGQDRSAPKKRPWNKLM